jgi:hypothetical protein
MSAIHLPSRTPHTDQKHHAPLTAAVQGVA